MPLTLTARAVLPLAGALALAACGGEPEQEPAYEAGVTDESGGELIVTDPETPAIEDVQLPETPMTPVAPTSEPTDTPTPEPAAPSE